MITWKSFLPVVLLLAAVNAYLFFQTHQLQASFESQQPPGESDIIALIDERITVLEKRKAKQVLAQLVDRYQLAAEEIPDGHLLYGDPTARIILQEYADIECPYCRRMHSGLKQVVDHSQGVIAWEFKHFPLSNHNPAAAIEAQAIECIRETYGNRIAWVAIEKLMAETKGNGKGLESIPTLAQSFSLNGSLINTCLASDSHKDAINRDYSEGRNAGISATPALNIIDKQTGRHYLVKGYKTPEQLLQVIQNILTQ
ncbi:thioredoxin domain-containing protein [Pseudoalteromonas sp. APC 3358]|uniref:DsbA family protein n=1 Tax=Pseudoalteromonas sp. APC 3358 TaxID=3035176 RepID=UPI0025B35D26|nr:thioredoxin domain-containing protein [Pseudoalteromonas sp. APC 3358]MDN3385103.1 thioredoxin domain-containing protein [Pseudoalteromonas sp. APC 3358]